MEQKETIFEADNFIDIGDAGCAYSPMTEIGKLLKQMGEGQTLEVRATDIAVQAELPVWCRLAGHRLLNQQSDRYLLQRK